MKGMSLCSHCLLSSARLRRERLLRWLHDVINCLNVLYNSLFTRVSLVILSVILIESHFRL